MRVSMAMATDAKLNGTEWRVYAAVLTLTGTWSKLSDYCYTEQVAALANVPPKKTREILGKLGRLRIIVYRPARGRHRRSLIGLPFGEEKAPESEALSSTQEKAPESEALSAEKAPGSDAKNAPESEAPTEKASEEKAAAAVSPGSGDEPHAFTSLMDGIDLRGAARRVLLEALEREPERVAACVAEWRRKHGEGTARGVGLLVKMVKDGDWPKQGAVIELTPPFDLAMRWARATGWSIAAEDRLDTLSYRDKLTSEEQAQVLAECERAAEENRPAA
jgi:hypothetical protein